MTILDVARHAGVGKSTVSRVVNNDPRVGSDTRARVREAMRLLCYVPNIAAQQLKGTRPLKLGMAFSGGATAGYSYQIIRGALDQAAAVGCQLMISDSIAELVASGVDGVLIGPFQYRLPGLVESLLKAGISVACLNAPSPDPSIPTVRFDHEGGAREVADHLLALGHRQFGIVTGDPRINDSHARKRGFLAQLEAAGISSDDVRIEEGDFTFWSGANAAERLFRDGERPTAIFAFNDDMAAGVLSVAHRFKVRIPEDVSVIGFDDMPLASEVWPPLTTVRQDPRAMTAKGIEYLAEHARRKSDPTFRPADSVWAPVLVLRESAAPPNS